MVTGTRLSIARAACSAAPIVLNGLCGEPDDADGTVPAPAWAFTWYQTPGASRPSLDGVEMTAIPRIRPVATNHRRMLPLLWRTERWRARSKTYAREPRAPHVPCPLGEHATLPRPAAHYGQFSNLASLTRLSLPTPAW